ncbi:MAG: sensor histidine kinase [Rhodospirillaceae bacterium]|nr:sensor histidine kinase [Rhodospirillaceae bacterium]
MDTQRDIEPEAAARPRAAGFVPVPGARSVSLHVRLALLVAGTALPVLLLAGFIVYSGYERTRSEAADRVLQMTKSGMTAVDRELQNQLSALQILALEPELVEGDFEEFRDDADRFIQVRSGYVVAISDANGNQVFNSRRRGLLAPWVNRDAYDVVMKTKKPAVSDIYVGGITSEPTFTVNVPVMREGEVAYVVGYSPPRDIYFEILRRLALPEGWVVSLYDASGHHIARQPRLERKQITSAPSHLKTEVAKGGSGLAPARSLEGEPVLAAFTRSEETGWALVIGIPQTSLDRPARDSLVLTVAIGALMLLVGLAFASKLATRLVRAESDRSLLMNELNHRVKNTLSAVQGIVARGLPDIPENAAYRRAAESRLHALSSAHNILSNQKWESAALADIARSVVEPYGTHERLHLEGPAVILAPRIAIPVAMVLNELATNAVKYGALSAGAGSLHLLWSYAAPDRLRIDWRESGGPVAHPPGKLGYGTRFIERAVNAELKGTYASAYPPEGFTCTIEIPL